MRRVLLGVAGVALAGVGYLLLGPSAIDPVAWQPPPVSPLEGAYALNDRASKAEWLAKELPGPEGIAFDAQGRLVTGLLDGRIVRFESGGAVLTLGDTGGRPLGLEYHPDGRLLICDAYKGLLALGADGKLETLATGEGGVPFQFTDDLTIARDGTVYFTDASARHPIARFTEDLLEHQTTGRLLRWSPSTREVTRVADGFSFANGVALGPDEQWMVLAETGTYRLWKIHLDGRKELFTDSLPGFPDNVTYSPSRRVFWVAIGSPRNPMVDALAPHPFWRGVVARLPKAVQPAPERHAFALAVDESGKPVESVQWRSPDSYSPVASALEHEGFLYLGSFAREGWARVALER